jgi:hypothetical protein
MEDKNAKKEQAYQKVVIEIMKINEFC